MENNPQEKEDITEENTDNPNENSCIKQTETNERILTPKKVKIRANKKVVSILLAILIFISGGVVSWFLLDQETRSFLKVKFLIDAYYYGDEKNDFYDVVFDAINQQYLDPYSSYYTADEYELTKLQSTGARNGVGLSFLRNTENELQIVRVSGNSPAELVGLKAGDQVLSVGKEQGNLTACTTFDEFVALLALFETGEPFYIKVLSEGAEKTVLISKQAYVENYVFYRSGDTAYRFTGDRAMTLMVGGEPLPTLGTDTAYICLTSFNGEAATEFDKAMQVFSQEQKKHLVLDLRGNGGGSLDILCDIAKYFCKDSNTKKPLISVAKYKHYEEKFNATANLYYKYFTEDSRIYVLADKDTASASEALLGCMIDYGATKYSNICLSERNGEAKTYGKGIMQMTIPLLFGGDALKITVAKIVWPNSGECIHGRGILPADGALTVAEFEKDDEEICQALKILQVDKDSI